MEIEITKPTPEQEEFQKLFQNNEERIIKCLIDETKELYDKLHAWEKCADQMYYYVLTYPIKIQYPQERVKRDTVVEEYNRLKGLE